MAIYKRGKTYWYELEFNGRRARESAKTGNPRTARQIESARKTELAKGKVAIKDKPVAPMFSDHMDQWLETYAEAQCKDSTQSNYASVTRMHLKPAFSGKRLDEIGRQDIADLINGKLAAGLTRGTARHHCAASRDVFNHTIDTGRIAVNPPNRSGRYLKEAAKAARLKIDPLTREEVVVLLDVVTAHYDFQTYVLFLTAVRTRLRMGELFAVEWGTSISTAGLSRFCETSSGGGSGRRRTTSCAASICRQNSPRP
jgi:integrase